MPEYGDARQTETGWEVYIGNEWVPFELLALPEGALRLNIDPETMELVILGDDNNWYSGKTGELLGAASSPTSQPEWWPNDIPYPPTKAENDPLTGERFEVPDYDLYLDVYRQFAPEAPEDPRILSIDQQIDQAVEAGDIDRARDLAALKGELSQITSPQEQVDNTPRSVDEYLTRLLVEGKYDLYDQMEAIIERPSATERFDAALALAKSPADQFIITAMLRGELPIQNQTDAFGRAAPLSEPLRRAAEEFFGVNVQPGSRFGNRGQQRFGGEQAAQSESERRANAFDLNRALGEQAGFTPAEVSDAPPMPAAFNGEGMEGVGDRTLRRDIAFGGEVEGGDLDPSAFANSQEELPQVPTFLPTNTDNPILNQAHRANNVSVAKRLGMNVEVGEANANRRYDEKIAIESGEAPGVDFTTGNTQLGVGEAAFEDPGGGLHFVNIDTDNGGTSIEDFLRLRPGYILKESRPPSPVRQERRRFGGGQGSGQLQSFGGGQPFATSLTQSERDLAFSGAALGRTQRQLSDIPGVPRFRSRQAVANQTPVERQRFGALVSTSGVDPESFYEQERRRFIGGGRRSTSRGTGFGR